MKTENLRNKKIAILGIQGSGKTTLAKYISRKFKTFVYTPHLDEWKTENVYAYNGDFMNDFDKVCEKIKGFAENGKIDMFIIDEADMLFKSNFDVQEALNDLIINHRHYNLAITFITRRPQDIPTKILETCAFIFAYALEGDNAIKKLNNIRSGFGDSIKELKPKEYKFFIKEIGEEPILSDPINLND